MASLAADCITDLHARAEEAHVTVRDELSPAWTRGEPALLERVWDEHTDPFTNVVRMTIMTLRRKLGDPPVIETVIGVGYRMT